jgi:hypothetical protein
LRAFSNTSTPPAISAPPIERVEKAGDERLPDQLASLPDAAESTISI